MPLTERSQAPWSLVRQHGTRAPGVDGAMEARINRSSWGRNIIPAARWREMSSVRRSSSSLNALLYGVGDILICATLFAEMPYDRDLDVSSGAGAMQVPECSDQEMEWTLPLKGCGAGESQKGR